MNSFWRKNYRSVSFLVLAFLFVGWTMFLNNDKKSMALERDVILPAENVPSEVPPVSPTVPVTLVADNEDVTDIADLVTPIGDPDDIVETVPDSLPEPLPENASGLIDVPVPTEEPEMTEFSFKYAVANVVDKLNIRAEANTSSALLGYLPPNSYCEVLEWGESWSKIKSGKITGYAYSNYLLTNEEAVERMSHDGKLLVQVTSNSLNIREFPNTDSAVLSKASYGQKYTYLPLSSVEGWYCIQFTETQVGYMSADFLEVYIDLRTAVSVD